MLDQTAGSKKARTINWRLWWQWTVATITGAIASGVLSSVGVVVAIFITFSWAPGYVGGFIAGVALGGIFIGITQRNMLEHYLPHIDRWVPATALVHIGGRS